MLETLNNFFQFFIGLGGAAITSLFIIVLSLFVGVKLSKALEGGLKMGIALTGMSAVIGLLTAEFAPALEAFVESTGTNLDIVDLGWAQMAVVTWSSIYTVIFALIALAINLALLFFKKVDTMNADIFNVWHLSIIGMLVLYYTDSLILSIIFVSIIYTLMLFNADLIKPKLNKLLDYDEDNATTTAHPAFLLNPLVMFLDTIIGKIFPFLDRFDFDAEQLNNKIGFWGSNFAVGVYLGIFVGLIGGQPLPNIVSMSFIGAVSLELFGVIGGWFGPAMEPLSDGIVARAEKGSDDRKLLVGVDWAITAVRPEIWTVANILAPVLMIVAMFLPGNRTLPLGGIILTALVPSLLFITGGKVIRMSLIGGVLIPLYLWASTLISEFMTNTSEALNVFPEGLSEGSLFTSIEAIPMEKIITVFFGELYNNPTLLGALIVIGLVAIYFGLYFWYYKKMKKQNREMVNQ